MRADLRWPILLLGCALCALASLAGAQGALDVSLLGASALDAQLGDCRARLNAELERKSALEAEVAGLPAAERALETALVRDVRALYRMRRGGPSSGSF